MLMRATTDLQVLATSRGDLEVEGEYVLDVPPLCVGDPQIECDCAAPEPAGERLQPGRRAPVVHTAVQLLRDRAAAVRVTITDAELPLAEQLCRLLGGIPLGIELSARLLKTVPMKVLVEQRGLQRSVLGIRGGQSNQDGLTPTLRWTASYLPAGLRQAWAILSVFEGGSFDLEAATAILVTMGATHTHTPLTLLDELIGQSILIGHPDDPTGIPRYEMLPPTMEFGRLLLDGTEPTADHRTPADRQRATDAHAEYFEELVRRCAENWFSRQEGDLLARMAADGPNVDAAIRWFLDATHQPTPQEAAVFAARGQQMAINYVRSRAPIHHGNMSKARGMLRACLAAAPDSPNPLHVVALALQAWLAMIQGEPNEAERLLERADAIVEELSAKTRVTPPWPLLYSRATWIMLNRSGSANIATAMDLYDTASREARLGHGGDAYMVDLFRGMCAAFHLPRATATHYAAQILHDARAAGAAWSISWALWVNGLVELRHGEPNTALELAQEALRTQDSIADTWGPVWSLWLIALCLVRLGEHERAAQTFGGAAAAAHLSQGDVNGLPTFLRLQRTHEAITGQALGEDNFNAHVSYWRELGLGSREDVRMIREMANRPAPGTAPVPTMPGGLTEHQWEIALLVAEGLTYKQIGNRIVLSPRTVEHTVDAIRAKLGAKNRDQVASWVRKQPSTTGIE
jgi:non-specific serine/threonine protein kinase